MSPRVFLVTGASTGFGLEFVEQILAQGDIAVATLRTPSALDSLVAREKSDRLLVLKLDITKAEDRVAAFAAVKDKYGRLDVLVNNAGVVGPLTEAEGAPEEEYRQVFDINVFGTFEMVKLGLAFMREVNTPQGGRILNISSFVGYSALPGMAVYNGSKHAVEALFDSMNKEIDPEWNIRMTLVQPGIFATSVMHNASFPPAHKAYSAPHLGVNQFRAGLESFPPGGDVKLGVQAMLKLADLPLGEVPVRQPIGSDAVEYIKGGLKTVGEQVESGRKLAQLADRKQD